MPPSPRAVVTEHIAAQLKILSFDAPHVGSERTGLVPQQLLVRFLAELCPELSEMEFLTPLLSASGALQADGLVDSATFVRWLFYDDGSTRTPMDIEVLLAELAVAIGFTAIGGGCCIDRVEERAIKLTQLKILMNHAWLHCANMGWTDYGGKALKPDNINLYDLMKFVVKPVTRARRCSFVELVAVAPQPPEWFVSHWWGEPVIDFNRCLTQLSRDRQCDADTAFWVCAYAINQWAIENDIGSDPENSAFRKAMRLSRGTVSLLDSGAVCYTRIWCIFEVFISIGGAAGQRSDYLFDIYTCSKEADVYGITDGYVPADGKPEKRARRKRHRESRFPFELVRSALSIKIEKAEASQELDRRCILSCIAGLSSSSDPPPDEHPRYKQLNAILRGRFAAASWVKATERGEALECHGSALVGSELQHLALHFGGGCEESLRDGAVEVLAESLPPTLQDLFLGFQGCKHLTDVSMAAISARLPALLSLTRLVMRFSHCTELSDIGLEALAAGLAGHPTLQHLEVKLAGCKLLTDTGMVAMAQALKGTTEIRLVKLELRGCKMISDAGKEAIEHAFDGRAAEVTFVDKL